jgi:intracellular septation protein A
MYFLAALKPILLDLAATIFFLGVFWATGNIFVATAAGIGAGFARVAWLKFKGRSITPLQWLGLGLVVVFGGTTLLTHNPRFMMVKPTLVFFAVAAVMLTTNWLRPYLPKDIAENVSEAHVTLIARLWGLLVLLLGAANLVAALMLDPKLWAIYAAAVPTALQIAGLLATYAALHLLVRRRMKARAQTA